MFPSRRVPLSIASIILIAAVVMTGCSKPGPLPAAEPTTTPDAATGEPIEPALAEVERGQTATAGAWSLSVADVQVGDAFGAYTGDGGGQLMKLTIALVNTTNEQLGIVASDFTVTDGESYSAAMEGDPDLTPKGTIEPGEIQSVEAVFYIPNHLEPTDLEFVFQHIGAGMTKIKSTLK